MYPPIQTLRETLTRKDLPAVCEYDLEATEAHEPRAESPRADAPPVSELPADIELGKMLCEANEL